MDLQLFTSLIKELILKNDKVYLPKLGSFITDTAPAYYSENRKVINPPYRRLFFRSKEMQDDGLLVNLYAKKANLSIEEASNEINTFIDNYIIKSLSTKKSVVLNDFGTFKATPENTYFFVAKSNLDIFPDMKGLNAISIGQLSQISKDKPEVDLPNELINNDKDSTDRPENRTPNIDFANQRKEEQQNNNYRINKRYNVEDDIYQNNSRPINNSHTTAPTTFFNKTNTRIILVAIGVIILSIVIYSFIKNNINDILYSPEEIELIKNNQ